MSAAPLKEIFDSGLQSLSSVLQLLLLLTVMMFVLCLLGKSGNFHLKSKLKRCCQMLPKFKESLKKTKGVGKKSKY